MSVLRFWDLGVLGVRTYKAYVRYTINIIRSAYLYDLLYGGSKPGKEGKGERRYSAGIPIPCFYFFGSWRRI
jgi:hypothetical protein